MRLQRTSLTSITPPVWLVPHLSGPELRPLIQAVDESSRQADVVPHHGLVVGEPVDGAHAAAQISVDHGGQLAVSELRQQLAG